MSPKKRLPKNRQHPSGWRWKNGAWRYRVPKGLEHLWEGKTEYRLGSSEAEAYRAWHERIDLQGVDTDITSMAHLVDRYLAEVVPAKSPKTQESNRISLTRLRPVFGQMKPDDITPRHAYQYRDIVSRQNGATSANRDLEVLSHLLSMAVEWGVIDRNPVKGQVKKASIKPRDRLIEDWEIAEVLNLTEATDARTARNDRLVKLYIQLKLATGLRRGDLLRLRLGHLKADGIHVKPHKTAESSGRRLIITWDEGGELRALVDAIQQIPPRRIGDAYLFTTRAGKPFINEEDGRANAFDSLWQRFMQRVMTKTRVLERFQERDLRAKVGSESESLQAASERLGHSSTEITKRVYRRKPVSVTPLIRKRNG